MRSEKGDILTEMRFYVPNVEQADGKEEKKKPQKGSQDEEEDDEEDEQITAA